MIDEQSYMIMPCDISVLLVSEGSVIALGICLRRYDQLLMNT